MIDGKYAVSASALGKKVEGTLTLKTEGTKLSGTAEGMGHTFSFDNGTAKNDSFTIPIEVKGRKITVTGSVNGDTLSGKGKAGLLSGSFSGKRI